MIFLDGNHLESEIMSEIVLMSVTLGEPTKSWPISLMKSASYFFCINITRRCIEILSSLTACYNFEAYQMSCVYAPALANNLTALGFECQSAS
jgi:hypothetical protein